MPTTDVDDRADLDALLADLTDFYDWTHTDPTPENLALWRHVVTTLRAQLHPPGP